MTEKTIEVKTNKTVFEAIDGTEFVDADECLKYESTYKAIVGARFRVIAKYMSYSSVAWQALRQTDYITDDYEGYLVTPQTKEDCDTIIHFVASHVYSNGFLGRHPSPDSSDLAPAEIIPGKTYLVCITDCWGMVLEEEKLLKFYKTNVEKAFHASCEQSLGEEEETK